MLCDTVWLDITALRNISTAKYSFTHFRVCTAGRVDSDSLFTSGCPFLILCILQIHHGPLHRDQTFAQRQVRRSSAQFHACVTHESWACNCASPKNKYHSEGLHFDTPEEIHGGGTCARGH